MSYHHNHLYSVGALSDEAGGVAERYAYGPYGERIVLNPDGSEKSGDALQPYGFTGRRMDDETGLWHFRARHFDDRFGRFIGRDPAKYHDGMLAYSGGFVPNELDPTGCVRTILIPGSAKDATVRYQRLNSNYDFLMEKAVKFDHGPDGKATVEWTGVPASVASHLNVTFGGASANESFTCDLSTDGCEKDCAKLVCTAKLRQHIYIADISKEKGDLAFRKKVLGHEQKHVESGIIVVKDHVVPILAAGEAKGCLEKDKASALKAETERLAQEKWDEMEGTKQKSHDQSLLAEHPLAGVGYDPIPGTGGNL